ncbi:MAG: RNA polymerase sigma factor, partial [Hormoscilla sp.]
MKGNVTEAEDALSQARIKAWEQVQKHASKIGNLKAWLIKLTINLCKDIIDKRSRGPAAVEDIELVGDDGALCTASSVPLPEKVLETNETSEKIRRAVASLPQKQRDTFILHFYEGLKHKEIVERLGISYDNVCKRLSLARQGLKKALQSYFRDEEQKLQKSPTPQGRVEKRKIESPVELELELTTVSTASDGVVGEGLLVFKDGAVERSADVEENMVEKELNSAKLSIGKDCVGEEKLDLISGAGEHLAPVSSSRKEESILGLAQMSEPTPLFMVDKQNILEDVSQVSADDVMGVVQVIVEHESTPVCTQLDASTPVRAPVASGELLLSRAEQKPGFCEVFFHGDRDSKRNPVSQGRRALGNGSARSPGGTVRAANAIAPVVVDRKLSDVSTVDVEHMLWDDGSRVRSPVTPRASGFHRFGSQLPATVAPEWVPVRDI